MTDLKDEHVKQKLPKDARLAAKCLQETGSFETGQAILRGCADRIEELKAELAGGSFYQEKDIDALQDRIEELEAKLKLADVLAHEVERRMVDLGGFDNRFTLRKALEAYRAPLKGQNDE
jgi:hypothetical protein